MNEHESQTKTQAFDKLEQEGRIARTARMLDVKARLQNNQRDDIIERFRVFTEEHSYTQAAVAREIDISSTTISEVLRKQYSGKTSDSQLVKIHNWMELAARRINMFHKRNYVDHSVAREVLTVAEIVAETCKIGVVFGPSHIGKTFTLKAIVDDQRYGSPKMIRVDESRLTPLKLLREIASVFELAVSGTFDIVMRRVIGRLKDTKRMLIFDEIERVTYKTLEMIRDIHDQTGCPVLLCGKPMIYEKLGFRGMGDFSEVTDQLSSRIIIKRDLTERTRDKDNPQPLFTLDDIRKFIKVSSLQLKVEPSAVKRLQMRACALGMGGIGRMLGTLYMAYKVAFVSGNNVITVTDLEEVDKFSMGKEDSLRMDEQAVESIGIKRVV